MTDSQAIPEHPDGFPRFQERPPWWGPHLQTLRRKIFSNGLHTANIPQERLLIPLSDGTGDALVAYLLKPSRSNRDDAEKRPLLVLLHGLGGNTESNYLQASALYHHRQGYRVLMVNMRGAGPSGPYCRSHNHPGRDEDICYLLRSLETFEQRSLLSKKSVLKGFSLGGNILLKFLGSYASQFPVAGAVAVSAPLDLKATSKSLNRLKNKPYEWYILRRVRREVLRDGGWLEDGERERIKSVHTIWDLDDQVTAPRSGYSGAEEYYEANSCIRFLGEIRTPTLLIYALNDPVVPSEEYLSFPWKSNPYLIPLLVPGGGHAGFHGKGETVGWHDQCISHFLKSFVEKE